MNWPGQTFIKDSRINQKSWTNLTEKFLYLINLIKATKLYLSMHIIKCWFHLQVYIIYHQNTVKPFGKVKCSWLLKCTVYFHFLSYLFLFKKGIFIFFMWHIFSKIIVNSFFLFIMQCTLDFNPTNSLIGVLLFSFFILPIIFVLV